MVKNLPANAEDMGLIPGPGTKIPHPAEQPSPWARTTEKQEKPPQWEAHTLQQSIASPPHPLSAARESL